jgi:hypothetical protein
MWREETTLMRALIRASTCSALLAGALVAFAGTARAQGSTFVEHKTSDGQDVRFKDDPMTAITGNPVGAQLSGFHPPKRFDLMPPRKSFVPELLKSIEHL